MKKLILFFAGILLASVTFAQTDGLAINLGFGAPIMRENLYGSGEAHAYDMRDYKTVYKGFKVGLIYDATIVKGFGCVMGLNYTYGVNVDKWAAVDPLSYTGYPQLRTVSQFHSFEIPVDWQYKFQVAGGTYLILYTGPTIQVHVAARDKYYYKETVFSDVKVSRDINPFSEDDMGGFTYSRYNVLWGVGAGFQFERYFIRGGYDFGIVNGYKHSTLPVGENNVHIRSRLDQWQIKLGVYLWSPQD